MKVCSIFSQVLKLFSRGEFEKAVKEHKAERHARGFTSWGQFMAMLFCQLGRAHSLREICGGLACCEGQLKHLGVPVATQEVHAGLSLRWRAFSFLLHRNEARMVELEAGVGIPRRPVLKNLAAAGTKFRHPGIVGIHRPDHPAGIDRDAIR